MFAIVAISGKQYLVSQGQRLSVDALAVEAGKTVRFDAVLLVAGGARIQVGQPQVAGVTVEAKVLRQYRGDKVTVLKYKPKVRYRKKFGHRQSLTELEVTNIHRGQ
ncbi:MAG: 50S ribosomal protein L21 [Candidatus Kerfeldbacteria bacterium]|nr:50S ribosomal protein L21 [Candidatus Kerfeldbacteria bacterium]